jgi:hypothetical protein
VCDKRYCPHQHNIESTVKPVYQQGLIRSRDAQFELIDTLLQGQFIRSFPELSLSSLFRRKWPSAYTAIEESKQDRQ